MQGKTTAAFLCVIWFFFLCVSLIFRDACRRFNGHAFLVCSYRHSERSARSLSRVTNRASVTLPTFEEYIWNRRQARVTIGQRIDQYRCTPVARLLSHPVWWIRKPSRPPTREQEEWEILVSRSRTPTSLFASRRGAFIINLAAGQLKGSEINNCLRKRWAETSLFVAVFALLIRVSRW